MEGKVVIVTGANAGIGLETARQLYAKGAHVIVACRSQQRAESAIQNIKSTTKSNGKLEFIPLALDSFTSVHDFAGRFKQKRLPLHVLVCNAGLNSYSVPPDQQRTTEGFDFMWQVNYLSHFLLTQLLLEDLKKSAPSRIVNLSSVMHRIGNPDFARHEADKSSSKKVSGSYNDSKLAMALISYEMQERLAGDNITVHACNPGAVNSEIWRATLKTGPLSPLFATIKRSIMLKPAQGCTPSVSAASDPQLGDRRTRYINPYWHPAGGNIAKQQPVKAFKCFGLVPFVCQLFDALSTFGGPTEATPTKAARDMVNAKRLYELSEREKHEQEESWFTSEAFQIWK
ncbi:hypothetical protein CYMTET_45975 [Cymbomonas tetramitiformis]|uniref:Protochlorophyllide reductase n=1 Tax=Cymbomonas tetramitiformis TaxID=36881 RepID=A0AAE0BX44_9CHLO|nr:hypothetical protein CYMTET_45975 [Cymbomonas tetramitiformis]